MATQTLDPTRLKYLIIPGWVTSKNDGDRHWITAEQLMRLYVVRREQCIVAGQTYLAQIAGPRFDSRNLIVLRPRYAGDYPCFQRKS